MQQKQESVNATWLFEMIKSEKQRENRMKKSENSLRDL